MMNLNKTHASLAVAAALTFAGSTALAQNTAAANGQSVVDVVQSLEAEGYTQIDEIDRDRDRYDVEATDPSGNRVELEIDAATGEIMHSEHED